MQQHWFSNGFLPDNVFMCFAAYGWQQSPVKYSSIWKVSVKITILELLSYLSEPMS